MHILIVFYFLFVSEKQEDEEFLEETRSSANVITRFDKSPHYIKFGEMRDYQVKIRFLLFEKKFVDNLGFSEKL